MMSQPGQEKIAIHMLHNILRNRGSRTVKFRKSIECNMRNFFLGKSQTKCGRETILRPFSKNSKLTISLDH